MAVSKEGLLDAAGEVAKATLAVSSAFISPLAGIAAGVHLIISEIEVNMQMAKTEKDIETTLTRLESIVEQNKI